MAVNKAAFAAVGLACVAAAGAGGYFAMRQSAAPESAPVVATAPATASPSDIAAQKPVQETESVVEPAHPARPARETSATKKSAPQPQLAAQSSKIVGAPAAVKPVTPPPPTSPAPAPEPAAPPARTETVERVAEAPAPPPPPQHTFDELVISR